MGRRLGTTAVAVVAVGIVVAVGGTGCAQLVCEGPGIPSPAVWLDGSAWFAAHPGDQLTACYGDRCQTFTHDQPPGVQLVHSGDNYRRAQRLTVDSQSATDVMHVSREVSLKSHTLAGGACGAVTTWGRDVRLNADGTLTVGGWGGKW